MSRLIVPGEYVPTISALLVSNEPTPRAFLHFHKKLGYWLPCGGHIEPHEDPLAALRREYLEEVGFDLQEYLPSSLRIDHVTSLPLPAYLLVISVPAGKPNPEDPEHFFLDLMYVVRVPPWPIQDGVHGRWFEPAELKVYDMPQNIRTFLKQQLGQGS